MHRLTTRERSGVLGRGFRVRLPKCVELWVKMDRHVFDFPILREACVLDRMPNCLSRDEHLLQIMSTTKGVFDQFPFNVVPFF